MANAILTPTAVTREALRILHEKLAFISTVNRNYDDSFATSGAKIGTALKIRKPNEFTVRTGATLAAQDINEDNVTLTMATQKGVDTNFTTAELTLEMDDFSDRILEPAMSVLASNIENDALTMGLDIPSLVGTFGTTPATLRAYLDARAKLNQQLAPKSKRCLQIDSLASAATVDALKGLFQDSGKIADQYAEGMMGRTAGFDWYENERIPVLTTGDADDATALIAGVPTTGSALIATDGWGATVVTLAKGSVVTFAGVFDVHQETKVAYSHLKQFTVTADTPSIITTGTMSIPISPAMVSTGAYQNISALPADNAVIVVNNGAAISTNFPQNIAYCKDAFAFVSADLEMPQGVHFAAREVFDGISMRIVRQYDINTDKIPCRLDVLYGFKTIRPELACRITG